jgi:hypothetical protein
MAASIPSRGLTLALLLSLGAAISAASPSGAGSDNWYPADVTPPAGTHYPCALTALPPGLPGIPAADRRFVNHVYSMVLRAVQAKLVLLAAMEKGQGLEPRLADYLRSTDEALRKIQGEPVPAGLSPFAADVTQAIELQRSFFRKAVIARGRDSSIEAIFRFPEAKGASSHLLGAWSKMTHRYHGAWTPETKDSLYHHLCALDFF